ncbi:cathepsin D [Malassezia cuniculi]|uniref:Cathepsin D n=1 Tax=Malassezia cuniculi TaxID=948313 RepID=A0AAF0ESB3_9BASI|nr:cathepsin D [Malassezia cuniculi]
MQILSHLVVSAVVATTVASFALPPNRTRTAQVIKREDGSSAGVRMPVYRRDHPKAPRGFGADHVVSIEWLNYESNKLRTKHSGKQGKKSLSSRQKRQAAALAGYGMDSFYFATVKIGTPAQDFNLVLDTGSADMWVVATDCSSSNCPSGVRKFDSSKSSTFKSSSQSFHVSYGSGAITDGRVVADTVSLANFTIDSLSFAEALDMQKNTITSPVSGIMGLGFESLASSGATPFWETLMIQNKVQERVFSFQLAYNTDKVRSSSEINEGGIFTLGVLDQSQYSGDINWVTVPRRYGNTGIGYWAIPMDAMKVNGNTVNLPSNYMDAVIDTGTTLIGGPYEVVRNLYAQIPGARQASSNMNGYYIFPCNTDFKLTLTFGGKDYVIDNDNLNLGRMSTGSSMCVGAVFVQATGNGMPSWIIGDSFLKTVFSVYRYSPQSIGFASLKNGKAQTLPLDLANTASVKATSSASGSFTGAPGIGGGTGSSATSESSSVRTITRGSAATGLAGGSGLPSPSVVSVPSNMTVPARSGALRGSALSPAAFAAAIFAMILAAF